MRRSLHSFSIRMAVAATFFAVYAMAPPPRRAPVDASEPSSRKPADAVYYRNCSAARAAGAAPIYRGEPGYRAELDRDGDGIACEPYRR